MFFGRGAEHMAMHVTASPSRSRLHDAQLHTYSPNKHVRASSETVFSQRWKRIICLCVREARVQQPFSFRVRWDCATFRWPECDTSRSIPRSRYHHCCLRVVCGLQSLKQASRACQATFCYGLLDIYHKIVHRLKVHLKHNQCSWNQVNQHTLKESPPPEFKRPRHVGPCRDTGMPTLMQGSFLS